MRNRLFNPDNGLMITFGQISDCIFLSLFFVLGCMPVLTSGVSVAALYDATFRAFRKGEKNSWNRFFHVFKANWKASLLPTLAFLPLLWLLLKGAVGIWNSVAAGEMSWMLFSALALLLVLALGMLSLIFPMLSRFENSFLSLMKNSFLLSLANLPRTLVLGLINAVSIYLVLRFVVPLFFLPSLSALLGSLLIEPMFRPFLPTEENVDNAEE